MFWPIAGSLCTLIFLGIVVLAAVAYLRFMAVQTARGLKLEREGEIVKAWVVFANDNLYRKNPKGSWWNALFVCTLDRVPDLEDALEEWAEAIRRFKPRNDSHEEEAIAAVLRTQIGYPDPIRIPKRITGKYEAYFISFPVLCDWLPGRKLSKDYVYCKFYKGHERDDGEARMVRYPSEER